MFYTTANTKDKDYAITDSPLRCDELGGLIGGVIGGFIFIGAIVGVIVYLKRKADLGGK